MPDGTVILDLTPAGDILFDPPTSSAEYWILDPADLNGFFELSSGVPWLLGPLELREGIPMFFDATPTGEVELLT